METRTAHMIGLGGLLVAAALGCGKFHKDTGRVVASVAGEKITEKELGETVRAMIGDEDKAKAFLTSDALKAQRNEFLDKLAQGKAIIRMGKAEGLDKDPAVKIRLEQATAQTYIQAMMERRIAKTEPTEAQLKAVYDEVVGQRKAAGQTEGIPPFEQVKAQLPALWRQKQEQAVGEALLKELKQKYPPTFADDYRPAPQP